MLMKGSHQMLQEVLALADLAEMTYCRVYILLAIDIYRRCDAGDEWERIMHGDADCWIVFDRRKCVRLCVIDLGVMVIVAAEVGAWNASVSVVIT
jgi:hypothetical protein